MEPDWIQESEVLIKILQRASVEHPLRFSYRSFLGLVRFMCPECLTGVDLEETAQRFANDRGAFTRFLLDIPEPDRMRVYVQFARDISKVYPLPAQHMLEELGHHAALGVASHRENHTEKLNRYLKRIDGAILVGRYTLAFNLTNRLLKEYYREFLDAKMPIDAAVEDIHLMSVSISRYVVQYFRKHYIPYSERRILLISTVTNVLATTMGNLNRSAGAFSIDKAIAIYARNNVQRIVRFLSRLM